MRISDWSSDVCSSDLVSRHTYDGLEYLAGVDRIVMFGGSLYRDGSPRDRYAWFFDAGRRAWERRAPAPARSGERRVGKGCVRTCRTRGAPSEARKRHYSTRSITSINRD